MARFSLKDHFTWMVIAGVVVAANGVIQTVGGTQPLGLASLAVGLLLIGLGLARPRAMSRDRSALQSAKTPAGVSGWFRLIRPVGLLLIVAALAIALIAGLPTYFHAGNTIPTAVMHPMWVVLALGIALLAFDWQRHRGTAHSRLTGLIVGIVLGLMTVVAATTTVVRDGVVAVWSTNNPAKKVLVFGFDPGFERPPNEMLLADTERALTRFLEAYGEFHPPKRVADANFAVLLAKGDTLAEKELLGVAMDLQQLHEIVGKHVAPSRTEQVIPLLLKFSQIRAKGPIHPIIIHRQILPPVVCMGNRIALGFECIKDFPMDP